MKRTLGSSLAMTMALLSLVSSGPQVHAAETAAVSEEPGRAKLQIEMRIKEGQ